jgi:hypothetical protein
MVFQCTTARRQLHAPETERHVDHIELPLFDNADGDPPSWIPISVARWTTFQGGSAFASGIEPEVSFLEKSKTSTTRRRATDTEGHDQAKGHQASTDDLKVSDRQFGRTNILTFDGGGVRSLSSLIILRRLMELVNQQKGLRPEGLTLKDLFSLVAGTSTGGLVAIMLGRLGMSIDDCTVQFEDYSFDVFGHSSKRGKLSAGIAKERYDGGRVREFVRKLAARNDICGDGSALMSGPGQKNGIQWYCDALSARSSEVRANII